MNMNREHDFGPQQYEHNGQQHMQMLSHEKLFYIKTSTS